MCPCQYGRLGAFTLTACIYWAWAAGGLSAMVAGLEVGDILAVVWAGAALFGAGWLLIGIGEALSHSDAFVPQSVLWSVGVIALSVYALRHGWYLGGALFHASRAAWFGWIASEVFNVWLNLRGLGRHREVARSPAICAPTRQEALTAPRFRRSRRLEWSEEVEGHADLIQRAPGFSVWRTPPVIGQDGATQIVYVPDERGQLIPVQIAGLPAKAGIRRRS
jgi:hypothetical protein